MVTDQDREEETALHLAVEAGHADVAKLCLDKGANVNAVKVSMIRDILIRLNGNVETSYCSWLASILCKVKQNIVFTCILRGYSQEQ